MPHGPFFVHKERTHHRYRVRAHTTNTTCASHIAATVTSSHTALYIQTSVRGTY